ncbi:MAG: 2'-5' RNA ligase family protein [Bacillota bacterium]
MDGIVTMLEPVYADRVMAIMADLRDRCGVEGGYATPLPHFSYHIAVRYQLPALTERLAELAATSRPFTVRTAGISLFTGERPVLFIGIAPSQRLLAFHRQVWELAAGLAEEPSPYYEPDRWVPHITLAMGDLARSNIGCVMQRLPFEPLDWELRVAGIGLILQPPGTTGRPGPQFAFGG